MRRIDADALQEIFKEECGGECACCIYNKHFEGCKLIDNAPTVESEVITLKPMTDEMTQELIDKINTNVGMAQAISEERPRGEWINVDSDGNVRNFEGNIIGHYGSIDIGGHTINTGTFSYPLREEGEKGGTEK